MTPQAKPFLKNQVTQTMKEGIAMITIDNPPVNAGSLAVRTGLVVALKEATTAGAKAAVIVGAGRCFIAGSDLREFGQPLVAPELPDVIRVIEESPFPVVAALHGVALGGGLELALGCDYRIAASGTMLGLPEVSLGFVPGAGGTQRLPRLTSVSRAIEMIAEAKRISAAEALEIGLIDVETVEDPLVAALSFLQAEVRPKRLARTLSPAPEPLENIEVAATRALRRGKGRPNVAEATRLVKAAGTESFARALADERHVFQTLRVSDEAFALRYLFFAERRAGNIPGVDMTAAATITRMGVIGGGTMGKGIACAALSAGVSVTIAERNEDALKTALAGINSRLDALVAKRRLTKEAAVKSRTMLTGTTHMNALSACDLIVEAIFEDMAAKKDLFGTLEHILPKTALIATNTSYLDIDDMARDLRYPERVLGLHFFNPADVMALLEVVRADATSEQALATVLKLARKLGKQPIVARVGEGFIGNRIYAAYRRRAEILVLDGATPKQVDDAVRAFGFAMGPFETADMSGLDIAWAMRKRLAATRDPAARYVNIADKLCELGRLGRKTGKGWYIYSDGKTLTDPDVDPMIEKARSEAGIVVQSFDVEALQRQLIAAIVNEAACLLEDGIAQCASDIDVALANGYGFPRWRGGPLYWASRQEPATLSADLDILAADMGYGHRAGNVQTMLANLEAAID